MNTRLSLIKTGCGTARAVFNPELFCLTLQHHGSSPRKVDLGYAGSRVLERLLRQPGKLVTRDELLTHGWSDRVVSQGSLNQQIYTLRQLLGDEKHRQIIQTLPRRGYLLNPEALDETAAMAQPSATVTRWWQRLSL